MKKKKYYKPAKPATAEVPPVQRQNVNNQSQNRVAYGAMNQQNEQKMPLAERNYTFILVGCLVIVLGFILMSGGGSSSPDEFNYEMFSFRRITLAPIVVVIGFVIEIYAILKRF